MNPLDKKLLARIAQRMETQARDRYDETLKALPANSPQIETARRQRDREIGDASDLREYIKQAENDAPDAARFRHLASKESVVDLRSQVDAEMAKAKQPQAQG